MIKLSWLSKADLWPFIDWGFRLNGGGYLYSANPYKYIRIGPLMIKRYVKVKHHE